MTSWFRSAISNDVDTIRRNLRAGLCRVDHNGNTALQLALATQSYGVARILAPFEHSVPSNDGQTALGLAVEAEDLEGLEIVLEGMRVYIATELNAARTQAEKRGNQALVSLIDNYMYMAAPSEKPIGSPLQREIDTLRTENERLREFMSRKGTEADRSKPSTPRTGYAGSPSSTVRYNSLLSLAETGTVGRSSISGDAEARAEVKHLRSQVADRDATISRLRLQVQELEARNSTLPRQRVSSPTMALRSVDGMVHTDAEAVADLVEHEVVDLLLTFPATSEDGSTLLMQAASKGYMYLIGRLMDQVCRKDNRGRTALMYAAIQGNPAVIEALVGSEAGLQDENGYTALMYAAETGSDDSASGLTQCVAILAKSEAGIKNPKGQTALMLATLAGNLNAVTLLADYEGGRQDDVKMSALMYAAALCYENIIQVLLDKESGLQTSTGETALMIACAAGHLIPSLIIAEAGRRDASGRTALMRLTSSADQEVTPLFQQLMQEESKQQDNSGLTALMLACQHRNINLTQALSQEEHGMIDSEGRTALIHAAISGSYECCDIMTNYELGAVDRTGRTALMYAVHSGALPLVRLLIGEASTQDNTGMTALMYAAEQGFQEIVEVLKDREARLQDSQGRTAMMRAAAAGHLGVVMCLASIEGGIRDNENRPATKHAALNGHQDIVDALMV
ncbi:Ankyrin repeat protein 1 [Giardia muris]|uniref:Ankyrin repeat protein 1 n=1 Tax=Giardia muris TaxID=5742 RepID=A0A4Z1SVQ2_GIAMU|nr:Ankyrin repeat protein 1 [Giardia muris]|eukprot:TNJ28985.1 Ankyrin repeat protein 1 [Giardia muris]